MYLGLPDKLEKLERYREKVSDRFFMENSLIGCSLANAEYNDYQKTISVESAVFEIMAKERIIDKRIKRYRKRWALFMQEFTPDEIQRLRSDLSGDFDLFCRACHQINEVSYYLEHTQAKADELSLIRNEDVRQIAQLENELAEMFGG